MKLRLIQGVSEPVFKLFNKKQEKSGVFCVIIFKKFGYRFLKSEKLHFFEFTFERSKFVSKYSLVNLADTCVKILKKFLPN